MRECPACFHRNPDSATACEKCQYAFDTGFESEETKIAPAEITGISEGRLIASRYRVVRELGRGGMGAVYLAQDIELRGHEVAVKMIHPNLVAHPEALQRFEDEVLISQKLTHTNIIRVHDLKRWQGLRFFTMEYVEGRSLREWIIERKDKKPPFTVSEVVSVIDPLLKALSYAHQFTIHRDIKPENIMIMGEFPDVQIKVLDFGIAKTLSPSRFTHTAHAMGTAYYMAPEQMKGMADIDSRADLYAVGMILYEMLTGEVAVGRFRLPGELIADLPKELDDVVEKALAPLPQERYKDAKEMRVALQSALALTRAREERQKEIADLLEKGQACLAACKWPEAMKHLSSLLSLDPDNEAAKALLQEAKEKGSQLEGLLKQAGTAQSHGDLEEAMSLLERSIPLSPDPDGITKRKADMQKALEEKRQQAAEKERQERIKKELVQKEREAEERQRQAEAERRRAEEERKAEAAWLESERKKEEQRKLEEERRREAEERAAREEAERKALEKKAQRKKAIAVIAAVCILAAAGFGIYQWQKGKPVETAEMGAVRERVQTSTVPSKPDEKLPAAKGRLVVQAEPEGSRIRILNIGPPYQRGMELDAGRYHVEVSADGHETWDDWIALETGEDKELKVRLKPITVAPPVKEEKTEEKESRRDVAPTKTFTVKGVSFKMVRIPAGEFMMGSPSNEADREKDETQHRVRISRDYWLGQTEVTQGLWQAVMGSNPSEFSSCGDDCPVERVSWNDCQEFIRKLNGMASGGNFRLPTEAEWEYACRAGTTGPYAGDLDAMGWYYKNSGSRTQRVGQKQPNAWGLYDMHGNVYEWCQDWEADYPSGSVTDPTGPSSGAGRVYRGGSWHNGAGFCRSAHRLFSTRGGGSGGLGFRLARTEPERTTGQEQAPDGAKGKPSTSQVQPSGVASKPDEKPTITAPAPPTVTKASLYVETKPDGALIRLLNIAPKFQQGIMLEPGRYLVEVSADGYATRKDWVELKEGEEKRFTVQLESQASQDVKAQQALIDAEKAKLAKELEEQKQRESEIERRRIEEERAKIEKERRELEAAKAEVNRRRQELQSKPSGLASLPQNKTSSGPSHDSNVVARDGQYVAYVNGIVRDTNTGLEWKAGPDRDTDWNGARSWVQSLGDDWRMPTMDELERLYKIGKGDRNMTPLLKTTGWVVWSGEEGSSDARTFFFGNGHRNWSYRGFSDGRRPFAVRSRSDG